MINKKKNLLIKIVFMGVLLLSMYLPAFAQSSNRGLPYLHIENALTSDAFQFNEKGVAVEPTDPPQALERGWVILSGFDPLVIRNKNVTVLLQQESVLSVVSDTPDDLKFYLVAGSASFLRDETYLGNISVNTPIGVYESMGPGEIFVSSDVSELIFSLGSSVKVTNTITRKRSTLSPYHYLDLADPFLKEKAISKQTYTTLSINPTTNTSSLLPSSSVTDGIKIATVSASVEVKQALKVAETPVAKEVAVKPVVKEAVVEKAAVKPIVKEAVVKEVAVEPVVVAPVVEKAAVEPVVKEVTVEPAVVEDEVFNVYIIHTNEAFGSIADSAIPYPTFSTLLTWNKSVHPRTLLVDAGNSLSGSEIANMNKGLDAATLYQTLGYDAISPSTAEYAFGIDHLIQAIEVAKQRNYLDILAANVTDESGNYLFTPYEVYDLDGYKVGVIGLSFPEQDVENTSFYQEGFTSQGQRLVNEVKNIADYVVVLGNITPASNISVEEIASSINGIDLIIDGKYGNGTKEIGSTLIVQAGESLTSVGVVELTIRNNTFDSASSFEITKDDIASPQNSAIAQSFNISSIPQDEKVAAFIASLEQNLVAKQASEVILPEAEELEVAVAKVEEVEEVVEVEEEVSPLAIQPQQGITTSGEVLPPVTKFGVKTSFIATKEEIRNNTDVFVGLSVNPYLQFKKAQLGLQAYYLTNGSLFNISAAPYSNLNIDSGILGTVRSALKFIDYFYYGEDGDNVFIQIDDHTPVTFGKGLLINNYTPTGKPLNEQMALYATFQFGKVGIQTFFDDMYLTGFANGNRQNGALRFSFDLGSTFELGVGMLVNTNKTLSDITLYPNIDASWMIRNKRTFQLELFAGATTSIDLLPFSITPLYNSNGSGLSQKLPNFQFTGGIEMNTPKWNISLIASAINDTDSLMSYGSLNDTYYSNRRISVASGIHFLAGVNTSYTSDKFTMDLSYLIPLEQDLSRIIPFNPMPTRTGDNLTIGLGYSGDNFSTKVGLRKFGVLSSLEELFAFNDGLTGLLDDAYNFIGEAGLADPYISLTYASGPFSVYADLTFLEDGKSNLTVGSTIDIGTHVTQSVNEEDQKVDSGTYSLDVGTSYTRLFKSGSDANYFTLTPVLTFNKGNFSVGIGPRLTYDGDDALLYNHYYNSPFSFSSGTSGLFAQTFDVATDAFALIDHVQIGTKESGNYISINKNQSYSMGPLLRGIDTISDTALQDKLSMIANVDTKVFDMSIFVNDLTSVQLNALSVDISPFNTYKAKFGLSAIASAKFTTSEKQLDVITTLDGTLPLVTKENSSISLYGGFSTLLGYSTTDGFKQMLYNSSVSQFLGRFNNYMISGGINSTFKNFTIDLLASTQEGAISLGMYNSLYSRERGSIITDFDSQWTNSSTSTGRTYTASIDSTYDGDAFDLHASYMLPITSSFSPIETEDLLHIGLDVDVKNFTIGGEFSRRGFLDATKTFINSSASIVDRAKTLLINNESMVALKVGVTSGNVELNAKVGSYTSFVNDGSYNGVNVTGSAVPILSLGAKVNLF